MCLVRLGSRRAASSHASCVRRAEARKLHFGEVEIDELRVKRLHVNETATENAEQTAQNLRDD
jgi:hypothetical protein